ncbi:hypothetical protein HA402_001608 [Bradysia odoriphaga]|nr:hypothetical protein HA402_001608 [Bradysia odoriphaga]
MDKIILLTLLSLIGSVTIGNAELQCHVCRNCPNPNELDSNTLQQCSLQTTTTTTTTTITPPEDTTLPPTDTTVPPTDTTVPPTDTTLPPTDTTPPPTDTTLPTTLPPTDTPPTDTPPTDTTVDGPIITTSTHYSSIDNTTSTSESTRCLGTKIYETCTPIA